MQGLTLTADTVVGRDGFLLGAEASYNVTEGRVTKYSGAFGFSAPEYAVTLHGLSNLSTFAASYYHRVSPDVEAGAKAVYDTNATSPAVSLEVGTKAYVHYSTSVYSCYGSRCTMIPATSTRLLSSRLKLTILVSSLLVGIHCAF
jgi:voltage-dependent anion channel protein 2